MHPLRLFRFGRHHDDEGSTGSEGLDNRLPPAVTEVDAVVHPDIEAALAKMVRQLAGVRLILSGIGDEYVVSHIVLHSPLFLLIHSTAQRVSRALCHRALSYL